MGRFFKYITLVLFLIITFFSVNSYAVTKGGRTAVDFLTINYGAKSSSMGGAFTSIATGAQAVFWNPSGLTTCGRGELSVSHLSFYQDVNLEHGSGIIRLNDKIVLAGFIIYLGYGEISGFDASGNSTGSLSAYDLAAGIGVGYDISSEFSIGINGKFINEKLDNLNATGFATDLGFKYSKQKVTIAGTVKNFGPKLKFDYIEERLPLTASLGISGLLFQNQLVSAIEFEKRVYGNSLIKSGVELKLKEQYFIRTGYNFNLEPEDRKFNNGLNFGLGTRLDKYVIDYAFSFKEKYSSDILHQFSFTYIIQ